jgi:hypothetical protein
MLCMHAAAQLEAQNPELARRTRATAQLYVELALMKDQQSPLQDERQLELLLEEVFEEVMRISRVYVKYAGCDLEKARSLLGIPPEGALLQCRGLP